jgi:hypothetical protein
MSSAEKHIPTAFYNGVMNPQERVTRICKGWSVDKAASIEAKFRALPWDWGRGGRNLLGKVPASKAPAG